MPTSVENVGDKCTLDLPPVTRIFLSLENSKALAPLLILNTLCSNESRFLAVKMEENLVDDMLVDFENVRLEGNVLDEPIGRKKQTFIR